jgi:hypothetical protein
MAIKPGQSSQLDEKFGLEGGSRNSPFEAKGFAKDVGCMIEKIKENIICF